MAAESEAMIPCERPPVTDYEQHDHDEAERDVRVLDPTAKRHGEDDHGKGKPGSDQHRQHTAVAHHHIVPILDVAPTVGTVYPLEATLGRSPGGPAILTPWLTAVDRLADEVVAHQSH